MVQIIDEKKAESYFILQGLSTSTGIRERVLGGASWEAGRSRTDWGPGRSGTEDDKDDLNEIVTAEMRKTGNHGKSFCHKFRLP